ncbi:MAG TPA: signal peptidase I [Gemmatimonadaceae bacterium]|nr:signal peptidase I [Gemmatimonadaceae bacterium]
MPVASKKKRTSPQRSTNVVAAARGKSGGAAGSSGGGRAMREFVRGILPVLAIFLFIRTFFMEAYRIPSESMVPALLVGDFLFVNKLAYGPHVPFTDVSLPGYTDPQRGDIAIYESPPQYDQPWDLTPTVVKRVVAVAGDTIYMREGALHVNGIAQRLGYGAPDRGGYVDYPSDAFAWMRNHALRGSRFGQPIERPSLDNWGPMVVPSEHFFALGDNRYNSKDARYYGFVPRANVRGKPMFIYYSYDKAGSDSPVPFLTDIRWGRLGHWIR